MARPAASKETETKKETKKATAEKKTAVKKTAKAADKASAGDDRGRPHADTAG